jgi:hypothetical protein
MKVRDVVDPDTSYHKPTEEEEKLLDKLFKRVKRIEE